MVVRLLLKVSFNPKSVQIPFVETESGGAGAIGNFPHSPTVVSEPQDNNKLNSDDNQPDESLFSADDRSWNDLVFENRNKAYGAYVLRKAYAKNVYDGVIVTILVLLLIIFSPAIVKFLKGKEFVDNTPPRKMVYSELSAPPPIDKVKPPPPQIQIPKLQKVLKFVPPKIVKEDVVEEVPTIQELKQTESAAVSSEGVSDIVFDEPVAEVIEDTNEVFTVVEQQPEFEGGYNAMINFIKQNMRYPASARRMDIDGTVHVSFLVSKTGAISEVKVLRGIQAECDNEAIRVVQMMPPWKPGKQNGKPVFVRFILPIKFKLH
jgi:protein TonB